MILLLALLACGPGRDRLTVYVTPEELGTYERFAEYIPYEHLEVVAVDDPAAEVAGGGRGTRVAVVTDLDCTDCYELEGEGARFTVRGDALGAQYGLSALLEEMGFRFFHPYRTHVPERLGDVDPAVLGVRHEPEIRRRGLHLHTLHPIEGLAAMWDPSEDNLVEAYRIIDWTIKNRGNHLQWVALDDIENAGVQAAWLEHTQQIVTEAHGRGLTVGLGIQLFGSGNLQLAFDLLDETGDEDAQRAAIDERLALIDDVPWDVLNLSFGEFFGEDPDTFITSANIAYERMQLALPGVEVPAVVHVGNYDDMRIEYNGEELLYYFLVKFADPGYVPWVHTTMFYDLYEDAGGAYLHDEFDEHRAFLLDRLRAGEPVGYFPESAYWVAFDNSVPQYFPLYVRSRWIDLYETRAIAQAEGFSGLQDHVLFSTGWEWGYWQNDYATLRMGYATPDDWREELHAMWAAHGEDGEAIAEAIIALTEAQHEAVLVGRLAPYLAGRDSLIDFGKTQGIVSQPDRTSFDDVVAMTPEQRAAFQAEVVDALSALAADSRAVEQTVSALERDDPFFDEVVDGAAVGAWRAEFSAAVYGAVVAYADGGDGAVHLEQAAEALAEAHTVVSRRHAAPLDPKGERWIAPTWDNATIYDYGYLKHAEELCFWERELVQAQNLVLGQDEAVPGCVF